MQLLGLKAELLRKQDEVNKAKNQNNIGSTPPDQFQLKRSNKVGSTLKSLLNNKKSKQKRNDVNKLGKLESKPIEENSELLIKSRKVLEAKAKLYEKLTTSGGLMNSDDTCLVLFNKKKQVSHQNHPNVASSESSDDEHSDESTGGSREIEENDPNELWTEYTDCLGRTRKCLKEDIELFKRRDGELAQATQNRRYTDASTISNVDRNSTLQSWFLDTNGDNSHDLQLHQLPDGNKSPISITKSSTLKNMRTSWEEKEQQNLNQDQIHYQDVLFDEARTHGVGYYTFSGDQNERAKQQQDLEAERIRTLDAQQNREQQRQLREKLIANRVLSAKNRQRTRQGLPPLEEIEAHNTTKNRSSDETKKDRKHIKRDGKQRAQLERAERRLEAKRQEYIRPWDYGKDGTLSKKYAKCSDDESKEWQYVPERREPLSQEQWNDMKRSERLPEFAPFFEVETAQLNRFSTVKLKPFKKRNIDQLVDDPIQVELIPNEQKVSLRSGTEIPPPLTFEYFGPTTITHSSNGNNSGLLNNHLESSIEAGLRFLREKSDKNAPGSKQTWVSNADY